LPALDDDDPVRSPCVSVCKMDPRHGSAAERTAGGLCVGCLRTLDEIIEWGTATNHRRRAIVSETVARKGRKGVKAA
jgi:predicted Fe-S protein YdhL (DUF1289 family)